MEVKRTLVINTVNSWVGFNEADGSYKKIIDIYNSYRSGMLYSWPWCACCASAAFIANGYGANEAPIEISCPRMVTKLFVVSSFLFRVGSSPKSILG